MFLFSLIWLCFFTFNNAQVTVNTKAGTVTGFEDSTNNYTAFYGIPYAGNVSGENRFKEAVRLERLPAVFQAINADIRCAQPNLDTSKSQENCLTLNVFTKSVADKKPVFVWLNGEEDARTINKRFTFKSLVQAGSVVVAVNYRLSIYGFLCLGVKEAPGNAGLKDVILALQWIKSNIQNFGGDQNNVILLGHGSGAVMVDIITLSRRSEGLVNKAIALSGSGIAPWAVSYDPVKNAKAVAAAVNPRDQTDDLASLARNLLQTNVNDLAKAMNTIVLTNNPVLFAPCIENQSLSDVVPILTDAPINIIKSKNYTSVPYIATFASNEGTMRVIEAQKNYWINNVMENGFEKFLPEDLDLYQNASTISNKIRQHYFQNKKIDGDSVKEFIEYDGDIMITVPLIKGVNLRAKNGDDSVYLLNFDYNEGSSIEWPYNLLDGTVHGGILDYILDGDSVTQDPKTNLINRFTQFAKTGKPTAPESQVGDVLWEPVPKTLRIFGNKPNIAGQAPSSNFYSKQMEFWNGFSYIYPKAQWDIYTDKTDPTSPTDTTDSNGGGTNGISGVVIAIIVVTIICTIIVGTGIVLYRTPRCYEQLTMWNSR